MNILITGGAGFLGRHLCQHYLDLGHHVIALDNLYTGSMANIAEFKDNPNFTFIHHNVIEPIDINTHIDLMLNFACPASPVHYQRNPIFTTKTSVFGALNMLDLAKKHQAIIVQASTSEVYGDPEQHPQTESYRGCVNTIGIRSCYDEGKRCAESLFFDHARMYNTKIKVIRIFNTYGPYMDPNDGRVVSNFIVQALNNKPLTMYGDGLQTRSFCYVDDLIAGITGIAATPENIHGPINLGNIHEFTLQELAILVIRLTGSSSNIETLPLPQDDPQQRKPDIAQVQKIIGWTPKISLEKGLLKTIEYFDRLLSTKKIRSHSIHTTTTMSTNEIS